MRSAGGKILLALAAAVALSACDLILPPEPASLDYQVSLGPDAVRFVVKVAGGPRGTAWVGFGASPLGTAAARQVERVEARSSSGARLPVRPAGVDAYRVDVGSNDLWELEYRVRIGSPPAEAYHRASSSSNAHLMLLGVDVLARFFELASAIDLPPPDRPLGDVAGATVRFDASTFPRGWQVVSASPEAALNEFRLSEHPARAAFAVGPYRLHDIDRSTGLRAALHQDWSIARDRALNYARQLARAQGRELGPPPGDPALMIFTPLPAAARPRQGIRTAGMVWDRTLVLFGGTADRVPQTNATIREMMAIFLGHELFHLYVPWGLPVTQPLSWLSEGWAEHMGRKSAVAAKALSTAGSDRSLRDAYDRYLEMGGARAGSLQNASESGGVLRDLLYVRGELVFRILSLEWEASGKPGSFDAELWRRLQIAYDGENLLEPAEVSEILAAMVDPGTVRRYVDGSSVITLPELRLGRR